MKKSMPCAATPTPCSRKCTSRCRPTADPGGVTREAVGRAIGFKGFPTTLVLDRQGIIRGHWLGYEPGLETEMTALVDQLLTEKPK